MMAVEIDAIQSAKSIGWTDALLSRLAANSVGLGGRLSITAPANASALSSTGYSLTGSDASSMIDLAGTWNTSGNPVALKMAITNTASGATSKLLEILAGVGGVTEMFSVDKSGLVAIRAIKAIEATVQFNSGNSNDLRDIQVRKCSSASIAFLSGVTELTSMLGDAANTLALRNGANAQCLNVYGTWTSASVFERMFMRYSTGNTRYEIGTETTGGTARDLEIMVPSTKIVGMDKTTEDNGFINFKATADADATSAISTLTTSGGVTHHIQIQINGVTAWIPCSTTDPS